MTANKLFFFGALTSRLYQFQVRPWDIKLALFFDLAYIDSIGVYLQYRYNRVYRIFSNSSDFITNRTRYYFNSYFLNTQERRRITKPVLSIDEFSINLDWFIAIEFLSFILIILRSYRFFLNAYRLVVGDSSEGSYFNKASFTSLVVRVDSFLDIKIIRSFQGMLRKLLGLFLIILPESTDYYYLNLDLTNYDYQKFAKRELVKRSSIFGIASVEKKIPNSLVSNNLINKNIVSGLSGRGNEFLSNASGSVMMSTRSVFLDFLKVIWLLNGSDSKTGSVDFLFSALPTIRSVFQGGWKLESNVIVNSFFCDLFNKRKTRADFIYWPELMQLGLWQLNYLGIALAVGILIKSFFNGGGLIFSFSENFHAKRTKGADLLESYFFNLKSIGVFNNYSNFYKNFSSLQLTETVLDQFVGVKVPFFFIKGSFILPDLLIYEREFSIINLYGINRNYMFEQSVINYGRGPKSFFHLLNTLFNLIIFGDPIINSGNSISQLTYFDILLMCKDCVGYK